MCTFTCMYAWICKYICVQNAFSVCLSEKLGRGFPRKPVFLESKTLAGEKHVNERVYAVIRTSWTVQLV